MSRLSCLSACSQQADEVLNWYAALTSPNQGPSAVIGAMPKGHEPNHKRHINPMMTRSTPLYAGMALAFDIAAL